MNNALVLIGPTVWPLLALVTKDFIACGPSAALFGKVTDQSVGGMEQVGTACIQQGRSAIKRHKTVTATGHIKGRIPIAVLPRFTVGLWPKKNQ